MKKRVISVILSLTLLTVLFPVALATQSFENKIGDAG